MITDRQTLEAAVLELATRPDQAGNFGTFLQQAEEMIAREVRAVEMIKTVSIVEADRDSEGVYDLPSDFLERRAVYGVRGGHDYELKPAAMAELRSFPANMPPYRYGTYGDKIEFRGVPATDAAFELIYFARPAALEDDADTNTLLQQHSSLYLNGTLHWLHLKAQDVELAQGYASSFQNTVGRLNELADRTRGSSGTPPAFNLGNYRIGSGY